MQAQEVKALGGFANGAGNCISNLSDKGKDELSKVVGLKKYLDEFTLIAEREIAETFIWKGYMVYATLGGGGGFSGGGRGGGSR